MKKKILIILKGGGTKTASLKCVTKIPILIVEDNDDLRELSRRILEKAGYAVAECSNGREALNYLSSHDKPCLILLDMLMPIMTGQEFMVEMAKRPHTIAPIPIYLVSATADSAFGKEIGCLGFVKKPFYAEALLSIVRLHCKTKRTKGSVKYQAFVQKESGSQCSEIQN